MGWGVKVSFVRRFIDVYLAHYISISLSKIGHFYGYCTMSMQQKIFNIISNKFCLKWVFRIYPELALPIRRDHLS